LDTVTTIAAVRERVQGWRREGLRVAFVPTMGNLHAGHVSLIEAARRHGERFVASIFVNPMQFGPNEDWAHYPRTPREDERMLADAGCSLMFMPDVNEIYPHGSERATRVEVPGLSRMLEGEFRPGHMEGVSTVVAKLFHIVEPDVAVFGEKDYQQLAVIRRMVADLCMPVEIVGAPTVRDHDGLAMSSRNQYLTPAERALAPQIFKALEKAAARLRAGDVDFASIERAGLQALEHAGFRPDYFSVRRAQDLTAPTAVTVELVILTAARIGKARLIDNVQVRRALIA
jgi:pantoate--beta-alanine ligase